MATYVIITDHCTIGPNGSFYQAVERLSDKLTPGIIFIGPNTPEFIRFIKRDLHDFTVVSSSQLRYSISEIQLIILYMYMLAFLYFILRLK